MDIRGFAISSSSISRSISCFLQIIPDLLTFLCNDRLGNRFLDLRELCLPLSDDLESRNLSIGEVRCSHQPVTSDFLIEINCRVLLQSNSENLFTEDVVLDALRPSLAHVEIVVQCLLSKFFRQFSITIVLEALDDIVHCEFRHVLCTELRFHNNFRLPMQSSTIQFRSKSLTIFLLELSLPELHVDHPLSKFFVDTAMELWCILFFSAISLRRETLQLSSTISIQLAD